VEANANTTGTTQPAEARKYGPLRGHVCHQTAFGCPREFMDNRFVYVVISARARGLSVGVNLNPDKYCNFSCVYCEVSRNAETPKLFDVDLMASELRDMLAFVRGGRTRELSTYRTLPDELLELRHVAISGDGEPTQSPAFDEAMQAVVHIRALSGLPFFKLVLLTNGTGLDLPQVQQGLKFLTKNDEIWIKLDAGTQPYLSRVNRTDVPLERILSNILAVARLRPVVIQSLFPSINGEEAPADEIQQYANRLLELKNQGAMISLVQIYSATRPTENSECGHLPLKTLSRIAHTVRQVSGLKAEVF
jgi:wyosine [tRNA(Phe)-imidazoG37] synthetase (radical SAM superfamily)